MTLMNTTLNRVQALFGLALSTLLFLCSFIAFLTHPSPSALSTPTTTGPGAVNLTIHNVQTLLGSNRWHADRAVQEFIEINWSLSPLDLVAGHLQLSPSSGSVNAKQTRHANLWNWNTKQIFLSLNAEWSSRRHNKNEAVVWDRIITTRDEAMQIEMNNQGNKYGWREVSKDWSGISSANFSLKWNVMPHVGLLAYGTGARSGSVPIPVRVVESGEASDDRKQRKSVYKMPY